MDRREFLKKSLAAGIGAGVLFLPKGLRAVAHAAETVTNSAHPDLVAVRGGALPVMFDRAMQSIGGMTRFVGKNATVVVKPNMSWDVEPDGAANTSPELLVAVVKHCFDAGASRVVIMDHSIEFWERSRNSSGLGDAIKASGATYAPADSERYYQNVSVGGARLSEVQIHESLLECDALISVPVLKHHGGAGVSISAKNLMGCVWNRRTYHASGLQSCIADFLRARKPDLNIIDANRVIARHGPRGGSPDDIVEMGSLIVSPDIVAADTAASMMLGRKPGEIEHIRLAAENGMGEMDLSKLRIKRIAL
jgi:uncharacterized protein (DUF362 family)